MKKKCVLVAIVSLPLIAVAQQSQQKSKKDTSNQNSEFQFRSQVKPFSELDQRKIYHWDNGQRATPAGRQATDTTARFARVFGDSAVVVKDPVKKEKQR